MKHNFIEKKLITEANDIFQYKVCSNCDLLLSVFFKRDMVLASSKDISATCEEIITRQVLDK